MLNLTSNVAKFSSSSNHQQDRLGLLKEILSIQLMISSDDPSSKAYATTDKIIDLGVLDEVTSLSKLLSELIILRITT